MDIIWHSKSRQYHLYNDKISYIMGVTPLGDLGSIYFGSRIHDKEDMSYAVKCGSGSGYGILFHGA